jgi:gliding motility-associated-like protein
MKLSKYVFVVLGLIIQTPLFSQITINADKKTGCDTLTVNFSYITTLVVPITAWHWDFGDGQTASGATAIKKYNAAGGYDVKLVLNGTDSVVMDNFILVGHTPALNITYKDTLDPLTYTYVIRAIVTNGDPPFPYDYTWTVNSAGVPEDTNFIVHTFDTTGIFPVRAVAIDQAGCTNLADANLIITDKIVVPNVFTPNNDGSNDELIVFSNGLNFLTFKLYAKTGQLVYKTDAKTIVWDGKMSTGEEVPPGIYYYIVETIDATPQAAVKGFLYIYR